MDEYREDGYKEMDRMSESAAWFEMDAHKPRGAGEWMVPTGPVLPSADLNIAPELTTAKMLCNHIPK